MFIEFFKKKTRVTELTYSRGQTLQLRQYEPTNVHFSAKAEVGEGDDPTIVYAELKALVDKEMEIQLKILQEPQRVARAGAKEVLARDYKKYGQQTTKN